MKKKVLIFYFLVVFVILGFVGLYVQDRNSLKQFQLEFGYSLIGNPKRVYTFGERGWLGEGDIILLYKYDKEETISSITNWQDGRNEEVEKKVNELIERIEYQNSINQDTDKLEEDIKMESVYKMNFLEIPYEYHIRFNETNDMTILIHYKDSKFVYLIESF